MGKDDQIRDWLEGKLTAREIEEAKNKDASLKELEQIIDTSKKMTIPTGKTKEEAWGDFMSKIEEEKPTKVRRLNPVFPIAIAAAIALVIVAYIFVFSTTTIKTNPGQRLTHTLPDGSEVILNASSSLSYTNFSWSSDRSVKLAGEAFFDVKDGTPFTVKGKQSTITVLGTSFNAYFREKTAVQCYEGSVRVEIGKNNIALKQGETTTNAISKSDFKPKKTASWIQGEFHYKNENLIHVIEEIERQYAVEIKHNDLSDRVYTGYFNDQNLEEALELVFKPMGLSYEKQGDKIIIK